MITHSEPCVTEVTHTTQAYTSKYTILVQETWIFSYEHDSIFRSSFGVIRHRYISKVTLFWLFHVRMNYFHGINCSSAFFDFDFRMFNNASQIFIPNCCFYSRNRPNSVKALNVLLQSNWLPTTPCALTRLVLSEDRWWFSFFRSSFYSYFVLIVDFPKH